jgi:hypothetical protein
MKRVQPTLPGFVESAWYEAVASIMRNEPKRFFLFSPQSKYCLSVYLDLKEKHHRQMKAAA